MRGLQPFVQEVWENILLFKTDLLLLTILAYMFLYSEFWFLRNQDDKQEYIEKSMLSFYKRYFNLVSTALVLTTSFQIYQGIYFKLVVMTHAQYQRK